MEGTLRVCENYGYSKDKSKSFISEEKIIINLVKSEWIFLIIFLIVLLNETVGYNASLGKIFSYLQVIIIVIMLLYRKFVTALNLHTLFMLTALEWPANLIDRVEIFTYRSTSIYGISVGVIMTIILCIISFLSSDLNLHTKKMSFFGTLIIMMGLLVGILGLVFDDYGVRFFISDFQYWVFVVVAVILFKRVLSKYSCFIESFEKILISVLMSRGLVKFFGYILGFWKGNYGGVAIFSYDPIDFFIPLIILGVKKESPSLIKVIFTISWILGIISVSLFESSGKGILLSLFVLLVLILRLLKPAKKPLKTTIGLTVLFCCLVLLLLFNGYNLFNDYNLLYSNVLFASKYNQVSSLLSFNWIEDPYLLPPSPQARVLELYNITAYYIENPTFLLTGRGFGGYFEDKAFYMYTANDRGGYSTEEVITRKFSNLHASLNVIFLKFGLIGIMYWLFILYKLLAKKNHQISLSFFMRICGILLVLIFMGFSLKLAFLTGFFISIVL